MFALPPQASLLFKYGNHTVGDLTAEVIVDIAQAFGITAKVTNETVADVVALLRASDIDKLADLMGRPEVLPKVMEMIQGTPEPTSEIVRKCRHCNKFNHYTLEE